MTMITTAKTETYLTTKTVFLTLKIIQEFKILQYACKLQ